ncbi:hypothetical protein H6F42_10300 [Pseudanabaena sp. FACHB-1998]|uniref:hypothetical protein n=1 Tax=Pseudanabaena sp. FACHB-1998 TaxID=2692858 RepID=UPI00168053CD|nr:hypothetical protein [Pseudanabaena sp. FACHB-1998]MBD2177300.1 hypothetical protein [Pseudanabaena sp. FACHB-1998]
MRVKIDNEVLFINREDVPKYNKQGSIVRNSYFWALRSIAGRSNSRYDWEFEPEVWIALQRMLLSFAESGYLPTRETQLEFDAETDAIPQELRLVSTRIDQ